VTGSARRPPRARRRSDGHRAPIRGWRASPGTGACAGRGRPARAARSNRPPRARRAGEPCARRPRASRPPTPAAPAAHRRQARRATPPAAVRHARRYAPRAARLSSRAWRIAARARLRSSHAARLRRDWMRWSAGTLRETIRISTAARMRAEGAGKLSSGVPAGTGSRRRRVRSGPDRRHSVGKARLRKRYYGRRAHDALKRFWLDTLASRQGSVVIAVTRSMRLHDVAELNRAIRIRHAGLGVEVPSPTALSSRAGHRLPGLAS
jgi:hypothetical protein